MIKVPLKKNTPVTVKAEPAPTDATGAEISPYDIILGTVEIDTEKIPVYMWANQNRAGQVRGRVRRPADCAPASSRDRRSVPGCPRTP